MFYWLNGWFADKTKSLNYKPKSDEMLITVHRWFANKSCPGDWLYYRLPTLASVVTSYLNPDEKYQYRTHQVVHGDTLWSLAMHYLGNGSRFYEIMRLNNMKTALIRPGDVLKIPIK